MMGSLMLLAYEPIRRALQPAIDRIVFANRFGYLEELGHLPNDMLEFTSMREMLTFLVTRLVEVGRLEHAAVLTYDPGFQSYITTMYHSIKQNTKDAPDVDRWRISRGSPLIELLKSTNQLLTREDIQLSKLPTAKDALADMTELAGAACFGIRNKDELVAFISLGPKQNKEDFNQRDLKILSALKLRIENFLVQAMIATQESLNLVKDSHDMKNYVNSLIARLNLRGHALRLFERSWKVKSDHIKNENDHLQASPQQASELVKRFIHELEDMIGQLIQENTKTLSVEADTLQNLKTKLQNWSEYGRLVSEGFKGNRAMEPINLSQAAQLSVARWEPVAQRKGVDLKIEVGENIQVWGEKVLIEQIIENLIDNALKATDKGQVMVRCLAQKDSIVLEVEDTGCGFPKEALANIFRKPFYQGKGRENLEKSTGIGLYLVNQYVKSISGDVEVESQEGKGSLFRVRLPTIAAVETKPGSSSAAA